MRPELPRAAFVDRDGVINSDLGHVGRPEDFHLIPHAVDGLLRLQACGYTLVVVTNQAGIAKGFYTEDDYHRVTRYMTDLLQTHQVRLEATYHCPHHPDGSVRRFAMACDCRKPAPGMFLRAQREMALDMSHSVLIGDKVSDAEAGRAAGLHLTILVRTGHELPVDAWRHADRVCDDLRAAAQWVCSLE